MDRALVMPPLSATRRYGRPCLLSLPKVLEPAPPASVIGGVASVEQDNQSRSHFDLLQSLLDLPDCAIGQRKGLTARYVDSDHRCQIIRAVGSEWFP